MKKRRTFCSSFIGIDKEHKTVVVILSNYAAKEDTKDEEALDILGYALLEQLKNKGNDVTGITD